MESEDDQQPQDAAEVVVVAGGAETAADDEEVGDQRNEDEDAVMESLPPQVETDKNRGEREKAPDNAEERVIHEGAGVVAEGVINGGGGGETEIEGVPESAGIAGNGNSAGSDGQDSGEEERKEEVAEVEVEAGVEAELELIAAAGREAEPEGLRTGEEDERPRSAQGGLKRKGSATSDVPDGLTGEVVVRKPKKRPNVWTKTSTRKSSKKSKPVKVPNGERKEESIEVNPSQRYQLEEKNGIQLSKDQKAEKVELSLDKLQASSEKGYRMVRATRGVTEGSWYFEITVKDLGKTGHTRLGWSTWKGDLQAPVGFDANSYAYRDIDGSKVHQAVREPYGEPYVEGDVIGFYIHLPNGAEYAPKYELYVNRQTRTVFPVPLEKNEGPPKRVPGSEVSFFKNGVCQGVAYTDIFAGEYFPAASMYTLPSPEKKCSVRFNFGPHYLFPPEEWGDRPVPRPMSQAAPPEGLAADIEEPPPVNGNKEAKKSEAASGTASKSGGKQRMAAERGNGTAEGGLVSGSAGGSAGGGSNIRTKRATDEKDKSTRTGMSGKKGLFGKGPRKVSLFPSPGIAKPRNGNSEQQRLMGLEAHGGEAMEAVAPRSFLQEPGQSSDEQTE